MTFFRIIQTAGSQHDCRPHRQADEYLTVCTGFAQLSLVLRTPSERPELDGRCK